MPEQKNISYTTNTQLVNNPRHTLDMYWPALTDNNAILVFIHGGSWISGSKDLYSALGKNLALKGITTAVINYRLGDTARIEEMADDCAQAVKWVWQNCKHYNGNPARLVVSGHSAGAHLGALISLDPKYFEKLQIENPIKACILIDAFGLNLETFIRSPLAMAYMPAVEKVFSRDPVKWKNASPVNHIHSRNMPYFIVTGSNTYPFVKTDNDTFVSKLKLTDSYVEHSVISGKNHSEMISQLQDVNNSLYNGITNFINGHVK